MRLKILILLALALTACATARQPKQYDPAELAKLAWPPEDAQSRVKFLYDFNAPKDLGIGQSFFGQAISLFAGKKDFGLVRPYAIAVEGDLIAVADPGLRVLHFYDLEKKKYWRIDEVGGQHLNSPVGVAFGPDTIYLADSALQKVFLLDREGALRRTLEDFERPTGMAFDLQTNRLYVADTLQHRIDVFDAQGGFLFRFGSRGAGNGEFNFPTHLSVSGDRLYVNDTMNFRVQTFDLEGRFISAFGHLGDGSGDMAQPKGVAADADGNVYVVDALFGLVQIFDADGRFLLAIGRQGRNLGEFWLPSGIFINDNKVFVADSYNRRLQVFAILTESP